MRIIPPEPKVNLYDEGFGGDDSLQRAKVGKSLSALVERNTDPMVIALHGGWGTGKTYFLKRWVGAHGRQNAGQAKTLYFDAFAHDYVSDPLPALVAALEERFPAAPAEAMTRIKEVTYQLAKPLARIGLALATYGATEVLSAAGDAAVNALNSEASTALERYWAEESGRRLAMESFREALAELVKTTSGKGAGLVIVIDELDRCRPDYALEVLEIIKHFFSVDGVVFVLGVNLSALENSVRARYGAGIDAANYLKKFINISLTLPSEIGEGQNAKAAIDLYLQSCMTDMGVPSHIAERLRSHVNLVARRNTISLRDIGKIVSTVLLMNRDILEKNRVRPGWIDVTLTLLVSKIIRPELHEKFLNATVTEAELMAYFGVTTEQLNCEDTDDGIGDFDEYTYLLFSFWLKITGIQSSYRGYPLNMESNFGTANLKGDYSLFPQQAHKRYLDLFAPMTQ